MAYEGLPPELKRAVFERDRWRCRFCGRTNAMAYDAHHIVYRRSSRDDVIGNLITLCRGCHDYVHGGGINKQEAQEILFELVGTPGVTGLALLRRRARKGAPRDEQMPGVARRGGGNELHS